MTVFSLLFCGFLHKFQSLFWWILYCDIVIDPVAGSGTTRFNPCFGGSYIVTTNFRATIVGQTSFNPCFGGSYIVTCAFNPSLIIYYFVSILVLVDLIL